MNKKEKILWIMLIILISIIGIVIIVFNLNKKDNIGNNNIEKNSYKIMIKGSWQYLNSYFHDNDDFLPAIFDSFQLKFSDKEVEICFEDGCDTSDYEINNNVLTIKSIKGFTGTYKMSFEGNYLLLEYTYDDGSSMIYHFIPPVG